MTPTVYNVVIDPPSCRKSTIPFRIRLECSGTKSLQVDSDHNTYGMNGDCFQPNYLEPPFENPGCSRCHSRLHGRLSAPASWEAYKIYLRRGGYSLDLITGSTACEIASTAKALEVGPRFVLLPCCREPKT